MELQASAAFNWNDQRCKTRNRYICQFGEGLPTARPCGPVPWGGCGVGGPHPVGQDTQPAGLESVRAHRATGNALLLAGNSEAREGRRPSLTERGFHPVARLNGQPDLAFSRVPFSCRRNCFLGGLLGSSVSPDPLEPSELWREAEGEPGPEPEPETHSVLLLPSSGAHFPLGPRALKLSHASPLPLAWGHQPCLPVCPHLWSKGQARTSSPTSEEVPDLAGSGAGPTGRLV